MGDVGAVVAWLPRIAELPVRGDAASYRMTPERARGVREALCRELVAAVPPAAVLRGAASADEALAALAASDWSLSQAQRSREESGVLAPEYSMTRRGMACGHVFRKGELIFRCQDCSFDDTCVQCATCYQNSIHAVEEHDVLFHISDEDGACCDCGDEEAWTRDLGCKFHSLHPHDSGGGGVSEPPAEQTLDALYEGVPEDVRGAATDLFASLVAFLLQVWQHAAEPKPIVLGPDVVNDLRRQPTLEEVFLAKGKAREQYADAPPSFAALLWNDEKHSFSEVSDKILEVCSTMTVKGARAFAEQVDRHGRETVALSDDVRRLVLMARRIGVIHLLVTVQPAFDVFVEEVAGVVLAFLVDLAGSALYTRDAADGRALKVLCTAALQRPWRVAAWAEAPATIRRDLFDPNALCMLDALLLLDTKMWKAARLDARHLLTDLIACREAKRAIALRVAAIYPRMIEMFVLHDREPQHSLYHLTVQLFSVPSIAAQLVVERGFGTTVLHVLHALFANESDTRLGALVLPASRPARGGAHVDTPLLRQPECYHIFHDVRHLLASADVQRHMAAHAAPCLDAWLDFFSLFHGIAPDVRAAHAHVEFESELWIQVFHISAHLGRIAKLIGESFVHANEAQLAAALRYAAERILACAAELSALDAATHVPLSTHEVVLPGGAATAVAFHVASQPVSFHHPMHWLFAEMLKAGARYAHAFDALGALGDALAPLFDFPLRVAVKLAQIRCNVWVRNGFAIRSQAYHYRDSMWMRDIMYDQDLFLLQVALALRPPEAFFAALLDRFDLVAWFAHGDTAHAVYDADQLTFMAEELLLLLAMLLGETSVVAQWPIEAQVRRELVHYLALGAGTYSEVTRHIPERFTDHGCFDRELARVAHFRQPGGTADVGTYELRREYYAEVEPFFHHYSRNQRERADEVLREKRAAGWDVPRLPRAPLAALAGTPLAGTPLAALAGVFVSDVFADVLYGALRNAAAAREPPDTLVHTALHLLALGIVERGADFVAVLARPRAAAEAAATASSLLDLALALVRQPSFHAFHEKLWHVLDAAAERDAGVAGRVRAARGPSAGAGAAPEAADERRRAAARRRQEAILQQFSAQQQSLLAELGDDVSDEDEADSDVFGSCILCQERLDASRAFGTLMHIQESRLVRTSPPRESAMLADVLAAPLTWTTDGPERTRGAFARTDASGAALGFPASAHTTGLVAVSCGHSMHVACFHTYMQSTEQRHALQVARNHPEDLSRFEYVCPLCKSLGNVLLPEAPDAATAFAQPRAALDPTPLAEWVRRSNIVVLKHTPAGGAARAEHQDSAHGTGRLLPWLVAAASAPHDPDLGAGVCAPDECHMLQRLVNVLQLLAAETAWARERDGRLSVLHVDAGDALYVPDALIGYTLAQIEIAQRGTPAPLLGPLQQRCVGALLGALGALARVAQRGAADESLQHGLLRRLLPHWAGEQSVRSPLLLRNPLGVLVEAAVLLPTQLAQVTALMYYAALAQTVFGLAQPVPGAPGKAGAGVAAAATDYDAAARVFPHARWLVTSIVSLVGYVRGNMTLGFDQLSDRELAKALCTYTLPFLRRAALLRRVVVPDEPDAAAGRSEYERLLHALGIPPPTEALPLHAPSSRPLTMLVEGWIKHAYVHLAALFRPLPIQPGPLANMPSIVLEHPHIYELLPLPRDLTVLLQQSQQRTCMRCGTLPPTGALCLFCGTVLCEQAYCCCDGDEQARGECNQHMEHCGGRVGVHFRIGSNMIVVLYQGNGCFTSSPYLNSHGEVDRFLLKARPQRLHVQRYDELRRQWLTHGLANLVARRIESTIDPGGWITF